jgi:hypothetical protein
MWRGREHYDHEKKFANRFKHFAPLMPDLDTASTKLWIRVTGSRGWVHPALCFAPAAESHDAKRHEMRMGGHYMQFIDRHLLHILITDL